MIDLLFNLTICHTLIFGRLTWLRAVRHSHRSHLKPRPKSPQIRPSRPRHVLLHVRHTTGSQPLIRRKRVFLKRLHPSRRRCLPHIETARPEAGNDGQPHSRSISRIASPDECVRKITRPRKGDWQWLTSWPSYLRRGSLLDLIPRPAESV